METFDWSALLADFIPQTWRDNRGSNVKMALIDTGVDLHVHSLSQLDKPGRKFFVGKSGFSIHDKSGNDPVNDGFTAGGHGTQLAAIMCGKADASAAQHIDGIAHNADLTIIKARDLTGEVTKIRHLLDSFELAADLGIEIAVTAQAMSINRMLSEGIAQSEVDRVMNKVRAANMVILAATENRSTGGTWTNVVGRKFPNNHADIVNVAAAPTDIGAVRNQITNQSLQFLLGGFKGMAYDTNNKLFNLALNNSCSVAIMGGVAALCLSSMKAAGASPSREALLWALGNQSSQLSDANGNYPKPVIFKNF